MFLFLIESVLLIPLSYKIIKSFPVEELVDAETMKKLEEIDLNALPTMSEEEIADMSPKSEMTITKQDV